MKTSLKYIFLLLFIGNPLAWLQAQNFLYKSKIPDPKHNGFHKIILGTALSAESQLNFEDIRILDQQGKELPYLLRQDHGSTQDDLINYPFQEENSAAEKQIVIIENEGKKAIESWAMVVRNNDAQRSLRISGSDDKEKFYVVRDSFDFKFFDSKVSAETMCWMEFPKTNYRYYKLEITNGTKDKLNIIRIGYTTSTVIVPQFDEVKGLTYTRKDSNKKTILEFNCTPGNRIDALRFYISAPERFHRVARIERSLKVEKNSSVVYSQSKRLPTVQQQDITLHSESPLFFETEYGLSRAKVKQFRVVIDNDDNMPLQVDSIKAYQKPYSLIADLKKGNHYFLYFGDSLLQAPSYDLGFFESQIGNEIPVLRCDTVLAKDIQQADEYHATQDRFIVWIGLLLVAVILLWVIRSMMKKLDNQVENISVKD